MSEFFSSNVDQNIIEEKPFYLEERETFDELEAQISVIPPSFKEGYKNVELAVSKVFLEKYGQFLTPKQIVYFSNQQIIYTSPEAASNFSRWDSGTSNINKESVIDGRIYFSYTIGEDKDQQSDQESTVEPRHFWAGRIAIYPLAKDEIYPIDPKWLISEQEHFEKARDTGNGFATIGPYVYTYSIGQVCIHEKVHGISDPNLPLPVHEAAAHYYQDKMAETLHLQNINRSNMRFFSELYGKCLEEIGDDLHLFIFGNITDEEKRKQILNYLKNRFSSQSIEEMSRHNEYDWQQDKHKWVHWETKTVEHPTLRLEE